MIAAATLAAGAVIASYLVRTDVLPGACYAVMAILPGACAGAADVTAGVFRGLVSTGRSPVALFLARIPAGLALSACAAFLLGLGLGSLGARIWRTVSRDA